MSTHKPIAGTRCGAPSAVKAGSTVKVALCFYRPFLRASIWSAGQLVKTPPIEERWGTALLMARGQRSRPGEQCKSNGRLEERGGLAREDEN